MMGARQQNGPGSGPKNICGMRVALSSEKFSITDNYQKPEKLTRVQART